MRAVFLGTPSFAVPTLEKLIAAHQVIEVVTQPDRPKGRGKELAAPPVKECALRQGLTVYQPERIRKLEAVEHLRQLAPDVMIVVGYGQIIPQSIIDLPSHGILNVHASLLPKYRGAAPIQWAIVNGETVTGITIMKIDAGLDTGEILLRAETDIGPDETAVELGERLAAMGAELLIDALAHIDRITPEAQDSSQATHAPILKKEDGRIDWTRPARAVHNRVRGFHPWPGAHSRFRGQNLHIWKSGVTGRAAGEPGRLRYLDRRVWVDCGEGALELVEVQLEGKKRMSAAEFANGQRLAENETLGG